MKLLNIYAVLFLILATFFIGCEEESTSPNPPTENTPLNGFQTEAVAKVFADNCATSNCHSGTNAVNEFSMDNHTDLMKGSSNRPGYDNYGGEVVIPFNSKKSLLYQVISGNVENMSVDHTMLEDSSIAVVKNWINEGAKDSVGDVPFANPTYQVFVCNQKSDVVSVIDGDAKVVSRIINDDFLDINEAPHMVKERDGFLYVTLIGSGKFLKYDLSDYSLVGEVGEIEKAGMIMIKPNGNSAYVSRSATSPSIYNTIYHIDIKNMTILDTINLPVTGVPHGIALNPDGSKLYVANLTRSRIDVVDATTDEYMDGINFHVSAEPMQTTLSPDGNYLYVSDRGRNLLIVIDTQTDMVLQEINVNDGPMHIATTSDGNKIFVPTIGGNTIDVIEKNGTSWTKAAEITNPAFSMLHGCGVSPDDKYVYVSGRNLEGHFQTAYPVVGEESRAIVGIVNVDTYEVEKILEIERHGAGLTISN